MRYALALLCVSLGACAPLAPVSPLMAHRIALRPDPQYAIAYDACDFAGQCANCIVKNESGQIRLDAICRKDYELR